MKLLFQWRDSHCDTIDWEGPLPIQIARTHDIVFPTGDLNDALWETPRAYRSSVFKKIERHDGFIYYKEV